MTRPTPAMMARSRPHNEVVRQHNVRKTVSDKNAELQQRLRELTENNESDNQD